MKELFEYKKALEDAYDVNIELGNPSGDLTIGFLMSVPLSDDVMKNVENLEVPLTNSLIGAWSIKDGPLSELPEATKIHMIMSSPYPVYITLKNDNSWLVPRVVLATHYFHYYKNKSHDWRTCPLRRFTVGIADHACPLNDDRPVIERDGIKYFNGPAYYKLKQEQK